MAAGALARVRRQPFRLNDQHGAVPVPSVRLLVNKFGVSKRVARRLNVATLTVETRFDLSNVAAWPWVASNDAPRIAE